MYRKRFLTVLLVLSALVLLLVPIAAASSTGSVFTLFTSTETSVVGKDAQDSSMAVYIISLQDEPLATYNGGIAGLRATSPAANGATQLNAKSASSLAYRNYLANQQAQMLTSMKRALNRSVEAIYHYDVAFNGMAIQLTGAEAAIVADLSGVASIQKDFMRQPMTDVTPNFIGATGIWYGYSADLQGANEVPAFETSASGMGMFDYNSATRELRYVISVSGIGTITAAHIHSGTMGVNGSALHGLYSGEGMFDSDHPLTGMVTLTEDQVDQFMNGGMYVNIHTTASPSGELRGQIMSNGMSTKGDGVIFGVIDTGVWPEHPSFADDGSYPAAPESWGGSCSAPEDGTAAYTCTNKLVGVQHFIETYVLAVGGTYDGLFLSGRDDDGHGTHTGSTAAGNEGVSATLLGVNRGTVSGIAPRAQVSSYKVCGPSGCTGSDLVAGIDKAVADGVHVINYSIGGGSTNPWQDADSIAFLRARHAGIFVATSAGNSGPDAQTVGSPGDAPWITTVGASTSNRHFLSDITISGPGTPPTGLYGASVTAGVTDFRLVDAEGITDTEGDASGLCLNPFITDTFQATDVVLCKRGRIARVLRGDYVKAGGGGGLILYNPTQQGLNTDSFVIPAVHAENDIGQQIKDYVTAHPSSTITVSFSAGLAAMAPGDARVKPDMMAAFSSRGSNASVPDLIKPDVTAPGVQILAGASPQHAGGGAQGEMFQSIQGTSMSSPHVAGAAVLIKALHPSWTPAEIQSALMSTSNANHVKEDGSTPADPFDMGAGRIDLSTASKAALVLDETTANFVAANPGTGGDVKALNLPRMANSACLASCSWTRVVKSSSASSQDWTASTSGLSMTVSPSSFTLAAGESQTITIEVDATALTFGPWAFGKVMLSPANASVPSAHYPVAVKRVISTLSPSTRQELDPMTNTFTIKGIQAALEVTDLTLGASGLTKATLTNQTIMSDTDNGSAFDDLTDGVFYMSITVPADSKRLVAEITESTAPDMDLYVTHDANGDGMPSEDEVVDSSTTGSSAEYVNIADPMTGTYHVLVQTWAGSGAAGGDSMTLATAVVGSTDAGNMSASGPSMVPAGEAFDIKVDLNLNGRRFAEGDRYYGSLAIGTDAANAGNLGSTNVDVAHPAAPTNVTMSDFGSQGTSFPLLPVGLISMMALVGGLAIWRRRR